MKKQTYKGYEISYGDDFVMINNVSYTREWINTDIDSALDFAKAWIDDPPEEGI